MVAKVALVAGARPNFIKVKPIYEGLTRWGFDVALIHTKQHYDYEMDQSFWRSLGLPEPKDTWNLGNMDRGARLLRGQYFMEEYLNANPTDFVVVVGDVDSTAAAALGTGRTPLVHYEAGLRSFDNDMPEERNRILTDRIADVHLVTEESGMIHLDKERRSDKAYLVGNVMMDTLRWAVESKLDGIENVLRNHYVKPREYVLVTLHRPELVTDLMKLMQTASALDSIGVDVIWALHPRVEITKSYQNIMFTPPMDYFTFVTLEMNAGVVLTDSGGVQEETTWLGTPCLTYRENTERPATCDYGTNRVIGVNPKIISKEVTEAMDAFYEINRPPLWDGYSADRVGQTLSEWWVNSVENPSYR